MKKKMSILLTMALIGTTMLLPSSAAAQTPTDEAIEIIGTDLESGQTSSFIVQGNENTPEQTEGSRGSESALEIGTYDIIGSDNRYEVINPDKVPYKYVCAIMSRFPNGTKRYGTGFMVGSKKMVTSAYNLYDVSLGGKATQVIAAPAKNGSAAPYGIIDAVSIYHPALYQDAANAGNKANMQKYDVGCVILEKDLGSTVGYFGLRTLQEAEQSEGLAVTIAGYPGITDNQVPPYKLKKSAGSVSQSDQYYLYYTMDTTYGQSGSPIYVEENGKYYVVGIHGYDSRTVNGARKTSPTIVEWLAKF